MIDLGVHDYSDIDLNGIELNFLPACAGIVTPYYCPFDDMDVYNEV